MAKVHNCYQRPHIALVHSLGAHGSLSATRHLDGTTASWGTWERIGGSFYVVHIIHAFA